MFQGLLKGAMFFFFTNEVPPANLSSLSYNISQIIFCSISEIDASFEICAWWTSFHRSLDGAVSYGQNAQRDHTREIDVRWRVECMWWNHSSSRCFEGINKHIMLKYFHNPVSLRHLEVIFHHFEPYNSGRTSKSEASFFASLKLWHWTELTMIVRTSFNSIQTPR